jgi:hypothetical protein
MNTSSDSMMSSSSAYVPNSPRNKSMKSSGGGGGIKMNLNVMRNPIKFAKRSSTGSSNHYTNNKNNKNGNYDGGSTTSSYQLHHHHQYQPSGMKKSQSTPTRGSLAAVPPGDILPERDSILRTNPLDEDSGATTGSRSHSHIVDVDDDDEDDNSLILDSDTLGESNVMMITTTTSTAVPNNGPALLLHHQPAVVAYAYPSNATVSTTTTTRTATTTTACTARSFFTESLLDSFTSLCLCRYSKQRSNRPKKMTMATPRRSSSSSSSNHRPSGATLHLQQTQGLMNRSRRSHRTGNNSASRVPAASTGGMSPTASNISVGGGSTASVSSSSSSILGKTTKRVATAAGVPVASKSRRIVYPIARYPGRRLNSPQLIQQRRDFLKNQFTFRPVQEMADEQLQQQQPLYYKNSSSNSYKNHCSLSAFTQSHHQQQPYFRTVME